MKRGKAIDSAATVGAIGSPATLFDLPDPLGLPLNAYFALDIAFNDGVDSRINYLMPVEVGAVNGLYAFLLAAELNKSDPNDKIVVLDVDGGGRSVPTLPLLIYSYFPDVYRQEAVVSSPFSSSDPSSHVPSEWALLTPKSGSQARVEATILAMLSGANSPYSGAAGYGSFYVSADKISGSPPVMGQIQVAHDVGSAYHGSSAPTGDVVVKSLNGSGRKSKVVFSGKITNVTLDTHGLDYGIVTVSGTGSFDGDEFTIQYENENICAYKKSYSTSKPFVLGPDSVAYVPTNGTVFDNSDLYKLFTSGKMPEVDIVAIEALSAITSIPGILDAWKDVRAAIPNDKCKFAYSTPWMNEENER